jgi:hypothetical protein
VAEATVVGRGAFLDEATCCLTLIVARHLEPSHTPNRDQVSVNSPAKSPAKLWLRAQRTKTPVRSGLRGGSRACGRTAEGDLSLYYGHPEKLPNDTFVFHQVGEKPSPSPKANGSTCAL